MFKKKLHLFAIGIFSISSIFMAPKKSQEKKISASQTSSIYNDLINQATALFKEFKDLTGLDLVKQVGGNIRANINSYSNNDGNSDLLKEVSDVEITTFFAPFYMLISMQEMTKNNQPDSTNMNINEVLNPINNFAQGQSMMALNLYIEFKKNNPKAANDIFSASLQSLYFTLSNMNNQQETN